MVEKGRATAADLLAYVLANGGGGSVDVFQAITAGGTTAIGATTTIAVITYAGASDVTLTLPAPSVGRRVTVKQAAWNAGRAIYLAPHGAEDIEAIDFGLTFLYGSQEAYPLAWTYEYDGTTWRLVASSDGGLAFDAKHLMGGQAFEATAPADGEIPVFDAGSMLWRFQSNIPADGSVTLAKRAALSVESVVTGSASIAATIDHATVDTQAAGGNVSLTLADRAQELVIAKVSTTGESISVTPPGTVSIDGATAGAAVLLPGSTRKDRPSWTIWRETSTKWWSRPNHRSTRWPTVATPADLPNVSGSSTQSSELAYGDTCATTSAGPYMCSLATPGAAVWVPIAVLAGQLGQTSNLPDVRGLRETSGPTLLTLGAVPDGRAPKRIGSTLVGDFQKLATTGANCQGLWLFNGGLTDSSGNGRTLTRGTGSDLQYPTKVGHGQYGQYVASAIHSNNGVDWATLVNGSLTAEVVLRTVPGSGAVRALMSCTKGTGTAAETSWALQLDTAGTITGYMYASGGVLKALTTGVKLPYVEVCHVAMTIDTSGGQFVIRIYVNGAQVASQTFASSSVQSLSSLILYVGGYANNQYALGDTSATTTIYGASISNAVLDATTIAARAAAALPVGG